VSSTALLNDMQSTVSRSQARSC